MDTKFGFSISINEQRNHWCADIMPWHTREVDTADGVGDDIVIGYAMGYSDVQAADITDLSVWRGQRVHLLGASPHEQYAMIERLTQPTLADDPPADIVGLDWNGVQKAAYYGEYWTSDGWQHADHLTIRETVRQSLAEIKQFWQDRGIWPDTEPVDLYGPAVDKPDDHVFMDQDGGSIPDRAALEAAYVEEYDGYGTLAFECEAGKQFFEYQEGLSRRG